VLVVFYFYSIDPRSIVDFLTAIVVGVFVFILLLATFISCYYSHVAVDDFWRVTRYEDDKKKSYFAVTICLIISILIGFHVFAKMYTQHELWCAHDLSEIQRLCDFSAEIAELFEKHNVTYWLWNGDLLGLERHGRPIDREWDMDFCLLTSESEKIKKALAEWGTQVHFVKGSDFLFRAYLDPEWRTHTEWKYDRRKLFVDSFACDDYQEIAFRRVKKNYCNHQFYFPKDLWMYAIGIYGTDFLTEKYTRNWLQCMLFHRY